MGEVRVAILFAYKWLYSFVKVLDEIKKKNANCFATFCWQFGTTRPPIS